MKIHCDVCKKDEASVFCSADEAALCDACDHRVHHANKLAGKHHRFSLLHPSPKHFPLICDICQERRAFLFCQQDRAILCTECDIPIHKANEHTQKHNRFLLTGVKLSANSALYSASASAPSSSSSAAASLTNNGSCDDVPNLKSQSSSSFSINNKPISDQPTIPNPPTIAKTVTTTSTDKGGLGVGDNHLSSISEYLIEMLPGWRVDEFLDSSPPATATPFGFCKSTTTTVDDGDVLPIWDADLSSFSSPENIGIWVPQAPSPLLYDDPCRHHYHHQYPSSNMNMDFGSGGQIGFKEATTNNNKSSRKWTDDDGYFTVPQISPPSAASKRSRTSR